jgi:hypothetical protein
MRRVVLCVVVAVLVVVPDALAKPPLHGVLVAGESLGGIRLGDSPATVRNRWGTFYGVCTACRARTWYSTYRKLAPQGVAVEFRRGVVDAVYTLWQPAGWRSETGLVLGAPVPTLPSLRQVDCSGYKAYVHRRGRTATVYYVLDGKLWGFALQRPAAPICH